MSDIIFFHSHFPFLIVIYVVRFICHYPHLNEGNKKAARYAPGTENKIQLHKTRYAIGMEFVHKCTSICLS